MREQVESSAAANDVKSRAIIDEILGDAQKKAARVIKKAEKEAATIVNQANSDATQTAGLILSQAEAKASVEGNKILAGTALEIRKMRLEKIDSFLRDIAEQGLQKLEAITGAEAVDIVRQSIIKGIAVLGESNVVLQIANSVKDSDVEDLFQSNNISFTIEHVEHLYAGEMILLDESRSVRYEAVFRAIYATQHVELLRELYQLFFGSDNG